MSIVINILLGINVVVCLLMILLVLMQRPKNEGLGAAFGGGMTENLFGAQTTNVLQTFTRWLGAMFFILALTLSWLYVRQGKQGGRSEVHQRLSTAPAAPATTPAPAVLPETAPAPGVPAGEASPGVQLEAPPATPGVSDGTSAPVPAPPAGDAAQPTPGEAAPGAEPPAAPAPESPTSPAPPASPDAPADAEAAPAPEAATAEPAPSPAEPSPAAPGQ